MKQTSNEVKSYEIQRPKTWYDQFKKEMLEKYPFFKKLGITYEMEIEELDAIIYYITQKIYVDPTIKLTKNQVEISVKKNE